MRQRDVKSGKVYYCGAERLCQLYPIMNTKKYKPAMKAELMEGKRGCTRTSLEFIMLITLRVHVVKKLVVLFGKKTMLARSLSASSLLAFCRVVVLFFSLFRRI